MNYKMTCLILTGLLLWTGCSPSSPASPTPTQPAPIPTDLISTETPTPAPLETPTPIFTETATPLPPVAPGVCADSAVIALIDSLKQSMLGADGELLSSLIGPDGMEVRYFRSGNVVKYLPEQALFLFETTYQANWGNDPASGMEKIGAFHEVIVPELLKIFNQPYTLHCNEIRHGGATYIPEWPYTKDFYSIHFAGTETYGFLDWHTWVVGVEYTNGKPTLYALMQFYWEP